MKLNVNQWLGCGLVALTFLGIVSPASQASAHQINHRSVYRASRVYYRSAGQTGTSIRRVISIPNQGYTNYVTGAHALYTLPGTVHGTHRLLTKAGVKKLANRQIHFMAYRKAVTDRGSVYYKIVSQHHSVRGWIYQTDLRSILDRKQQAADLLIAPQIVNAEMKADENKHQSIVNHSSVDLKSAQQKLRQATKYANVLKGTPDYANVKAKIDQAHQYLRQIKAVKPSSKTLIGLITIRSEYQQAAQSVAKAQSASQNRQYSLAKDDIKAANRNLRRVSKILSQIHNRKDRKVAMALFNQALGYVNTNYSFAPVSSLASHSFSSRRSNRKVIKLIQKDERAAQTSLMDLYPHLDDFDVALMDAYRAQSDLNQAQALVAGLKGSHVQQTELNDIQANQHRINALWNV